MKKTILGLAVVLLFTGTLMTAKTVQASIIDNIAAMLGYSASSLTSVSYTPYAFNPSHLGLVSTYTSNGNSVQINYCENGAWYVVVQTACTSGGNACGMTGSGFSASVGGNEKNIGYASYLNHGCNATTPPDYLCPTPAASAPTPAVVVGPVCSPSNICSAGNVVNSCTGGLVQACPAGCTNGVCDPNRTVCVNGNCGPISVVCASGACGPQPYGPMCEPTNVCSSVDGDVVNSCTGALVTACPYGCTNGACNLTCTPKNICGADGNVHDRCSKDLIEICPAGCLNGQCRNSCTQPSSCGPDASIHDGCGTGSIVGSCSYGCASNGSCYTVPSAGEITSFTVLPVLVKSGATTKIHWVTTHTKSCSVTASNGGSWTGTFGDAVSEPITGQTIITLNCTGADGGDVSKSVTINIAPRYTEQ